MALRCRAAAGLGLAVFARTCLTAEALVCQLMMTEGEPLQDLLRVSCKVDVTDAGVGTCECSTSFVKGLVWNFVTVELNKTLVAQPGEWFISDASGQCVASIGLHNPIAQPCPPGFYCKGGHEPPRSCSSGDHCPGRTPEEGRRCKAGYFCPLPAGPVMPCPDGALCGEGSSQPSACEAGLYCVEGESNLCPGGYYCPFASVEPRPCGALIHCPPGSASPGRGGLALCLLAFVFGIYFLGARLYHQMVQRGWLVILACTALVGPMWAIDNVLAGFLSLMLVAISANWALLRIAICPWYISHMLVFLTLCIALVCVWLVNPPWSMLLAGLTFCSLLGWLMSRQSCVVVWFGRLVLCTSFGLLSVGYFILDRGFTIVVGLIVLLIVLGLLASWILEKSRQGGNVKLPFNTRWRAEQTDFRLQGSITSETEAPRDFVAAIQQWQAIDSNFKKPEGVGSLAGSSSTPHRGSYSSAATSAGSMARVKGVSFRIDDVVFDLPDGKRILRDLSLYIGPGHRVAVMGASGSGKSTLLAVLSGRASYGHVGGQLLISGQPADDMRLVRNVTGFVPQDDVLHGELTVEENLRYQASLRLPADTSHEQVEKQVARVATDLNLSNILKSRVGTAERRGVSGGQRKRVSIGMELVAQPLLLFADEPTSGLDSTTSHEVVRCLNSGAARLGTTVVAVIHQPRYETLCLFDDLVLLGEGGCLVYAGETQQAVAYFRDNMRMEFPAHSNPADILLDKIQPNPEVFAEAWRARSRLETVGDEVFCTATFARHRLPLFRAVLTYMDRAMLQCIRAFPLILISQSLLLATIFTLCFILQYDHLDQFMMQCTLASLFLMLLQGVAAQRIFGADLLITVREAQIGMSMLAYFVAKDLAALFEVSLAALVFTAAYGSMSGMLMPMHVLFAGSWTFVYCVFGLGYLFSLSLSPGAAQMCAVVSSFIAFCTSGIYQPSLPQMAGMFDGRGWMFPAICPVRWLFGYLLTNEVPFLTDLTRQGATGQLKSTGYDLEFLHDCLHSRLGILDNTVLSLREAWLQNRGWVCSVSQMLLLGLIFRFLAAICLVLKVNAQTSGWARFFGQSNVGAWKLAGHLFALLIGTFLAMFLFAEIWVFGIIRLHFAGFLPSAGGDGDGGAGALLQDGAAAAAATAVEGRLSVIS